MTHDEVRYDHMFVTIVEKVEEKVKSFEPVPVVLSEPSPIRCVFINTPESKEFNISDVAETKGFNDSTKNPYVCSLGIIMEGILFLHDCVKVDGHEIGTVVGMELNNKPVYSADKGTKLCIKIELYDLKNTFQLDKFTT